MLPTLYNWGKTQLDVTVVADPTGEGWPDSQCVLRKEDPKFTRYPRRNRPLFWFRTVEFFLMKMHSVKFYRIC